MDYYAIGKPFINCQTCGATNDLSNKITEWPLMPVGRKISHTLLATYWGFGYGVVAIIVFVFAVSYIDPAQETVSPYVIAVVFGSGVLLSYLQLLREIRQSKRRMQDVGYRNSLIISGLMEGPPTFLGPNRPKELP